MSSYRSLLALFALPLVAACTVLTSETSEQILRDGRMPLGVAYALPKSVIELRLTANPDGTDVQLALVGPTNIADTQHRYVLRYRPLPNYDDVINVRVSPKGFLKLVKADTTDKTPDIIVNLFKVFGRLAGGLEAGEAADRVTIGAQVFDPTDPFARSEAIKQLNYSLMRFAERVVPKGTDGCKGSGKSASEYLARENCLRLSKFRDLAMRWLDRIGHGQVSENEMQNAPVQLWVRRGTGLEGGPPSHVRRPVPPGPIAHADCRVGLCYRPPLPYQLIYSVGTVRSDRHGHRPGALIARMLMPNKSPLVEIDIRRTFFTNKVQELQFSDNGYLSYMGVDKKSELVAISKLPVDIIDAILSVATFRLRVVETQTSQTKAIEDLVTARQELAKERSLLESAMERAIQEQRLANAPRLGIAVNDQVATSTQVVPLQSGAIAPVQVKVQP